MKDKQKNHNKSFLWSGDFVESIVTKQDSKSKVIGCYDGKKDVSKKLEWLYKWVSAVYIQVIVIPLLS